MRRSNRSLRRQRGQAIVEFALSVTLIFFMLSAAVDLGLAFFAYQGIVSAAQEGVSYGARWPGLGNDPAGGMDSSNDHIRYRVRGESGPNPATTNEPSGDRRIVAVNTNTIPLNDIDITYVPNTLGTGKTCPVMEYCDVVVDVRYQYKPFFFLAPVFGKTVTISAERSMTIHDVSGAQ
jgi:Flp pilus assembly protein TadG